MRACIQHFAWGLATAALMVMTPVRVAAIRAPMPRAATPPVPEPAAAEQQGGGWRELYCAACVGVGTFALYSGGITMLPVLLANPQTVSTLAGSCLLACRSALDDLR